MNDTFRTRGSLTRASPSSPPGPVSTDSTPSGRPASTKQAASASAVSGVVRAGSSTTALPAARAGASLCITSSAGQLNGVIATTTVEVQHRSRHPYPLKGLVYCALCQRRMQGQRSNGEAYYRCRYALEYALANKINHPRNVYLRERDVLTPLDDALASAFAPARLQDTITRMTASQPPPSPDDSALHAAHARLADCDTKLAGYRAALDAGADPTVVTGWITEVQSQRRKIQEQLSTPRPQPTKTMTREHITTLIQQLGDITTALAGADPTDRAEVYPQLGLKTHLPPRPTKSPRTGTA